jgi:hypothetical protein
MSSILVAIVIICVLVAVVILFYQPHGYGKTMVRFKIIGGTDKATDTSIDTKLRLVKIRPGLMSCTSATAITGKVFLSRDTPQLPLEGCNEKNCNCHYVFLDDQRSGSNRRIDLSRPGDIFPNYETERRQVPDRRLADLAV